MAALRLSLLLLVASTGCVQTTLRTATEQTPQFILTARPARAWQVVEAGVPIGRVVFYASEHDPAESLYSVQNAYQQELGLIDSLGKAWRYRPHELEAEWLTSGTLLDGIRAILGTQSAWLQEVALAPARNPSTPEAGVLEEGLGR